jgi:hypothetical protein
MGKKTAIHTFQEFVLIHGEVEPSFAPPKTTPVPTTKPKTHKRLPTPKPQDSANKFMLSLPKLLTPSRNEQQSEQKK